MLHVEYVITGMVSQESVGMNITSHSRREYHDRRRGRFERETSGHTRAVENMSTYIDLDMYNDRGDKIFSRSRHSILSDVDAYKYGLHYLLKRSPLYKK
jgi:hypothetical protein